MIDRRLMIVGLVSAMALVAGPVRAFDAKAFDAKAFEAAQKEGKPILVEVTAPWCPTCKAQAPILSNLAKDPKFKNVVAFQIDFDSQKDLLRKFDVRMQSTLSSFKGASEVGRSTGDTNPASIEALVAKSI